MDEDDGPVGGLLSGFRDERLSADAVELAAAYGLAAGASLERRAGASVRIIGLGRTGAAVAQALAAAGVGSLLLDDDAPVGAADLGPGAFRLADIGLTRAAAVRRSLAQLEPGIGAHVVRGRDSDPPAVDLVVFCGATEMPVQVMGRLLRADQPHLVVLAPGTGGSVGPLVVPGATACMECVQRRTRPDQARAAGEAYAPEGRGRGGGVEVCTALALAAGAARAALLFLDGVTRPACWSAVQTLSFLDGGWTIRRFDPDPGCGCQLQNSAAARAGGTGPAQVAVFRASTSSTRAP
jgi:bacteriocin biosynthesis cyclodehydratase domain-containing protein